MGGAGGPALRRGESWPAERGPFWPFLFLAGLAVGLFLPGPLEGRLEPAGSLASGALPVAAAAGALLRGGHWPGVEPFLGGGLPFSAASVGILFPTTFALSASVVSAAVDGALGLFLSASGTYLLFRSSRLAPLAALVGASTFALSGAVLGRDGHTSLFDGLALLPFGLLTLRRLARGGRLLDALLFGLVVFLVVTSGSTSASTLDGVLIALDAALLAASEPESRGHLLLLGGAGAALGLALSAPAWLPTLVDLHSGALAASGRGRLTLGGLVALALVPGFGTPGRGAGMPIGLGVGPLAFVAAGALLAPSWGRRLPRRERLRWYGIGGVSLLLGTGAIRLGPGFRPSVALAGVALAVAGLLAWWLDGGPTAESAPGPARSAGLLPLLAVCGLGALEVAAPGTLARLLGRSTPTAGGLRPLLAIGVFLATLAALVAAVDRRRRPTLFAATSSLLAGATLAVSVLVGPALALSTRASGGTGLPSAVATALRRRLPPGGRYLALLPPGNFPSDDLPAGDGPLGLGGRRVAGSTPAWLALSPGAGATWQIPTIMPGDALVPLPLAALSGTDGPLGDLEPTLADLDLDGVLLPAGSLLAPWPIGTRTGDLGRRALGHPSELALGRLGPAGHLGVWFGRELAPSALEIVLGTPARHACRLVATTLSPDGHREVTTAFALPAGARRIRSPLNGVGAAGLRLTGCRAQALTLAALVVTGPGQPPVAVTRPTVALPPGEWAFDALPGGLDLFTRRRPLADVWTRPIAPRMARPVGNSAARVRPSSPPLIDWRTALAGGASGGVTIVRTSPVGPSELAVSATRPVVLFRSVLPLPGWQARVTASGRIRVESIDAAGLDQALALPAGRSLVQFTYRPAERTFGVGLVAAGLVGLGLLLTWPTIVERRGRRRHRRDVKTGAPMWARAPRGPAGGPRRRRRRWRDAGWNRARPARKWG